MLPVNKKYPIEQVLDACRYYSAQTGRRLTFEWALIRGVNDTREAARRLGSLLSGMLCHVNAIPLNPTTGYAGLASSKEASLLFKAELELMGIGCTVRLRRGIGIAAGCGQLVVVLGWGLCGVLAMRISCCQEDHDRRDRPMETDPSL